MWIERGKFLSCWRNVSSDGEVLIIGSCSSQTLASAMAKVRLLSDEHHVSERPAEQRWRQPSTSAAQHKLSPRYDGGVPWRKWDTRTRSQNQIISRTRSQWSWQSNELMWSDLLAEKISWAAAFSTDCNLGCVEQLRQCCFVLVHLSNVNVCRLNATKSWQWSMRSRHGSRITPVLELQIFASGFLIPIMVSVGLIYWHYSRVSIISDFYLCVESVPSVLWHCWLGWLGSRKGIRLVKKPEWWGAGMVICLERGADMHMAQLVPLPLTVSCFSKIQIGVTFLVSAHPGSPGQRAIKRVCV